MGKCEMNALVPTGTSALNDPAAFVTVIPTISFKGRDEKWRKRETN